MYDYTNPNDIQSIRDKAFKDIEKLDLLDAQRLNENLKKLSIAYNNYGILIKRYNFIRNEIDEIKKKYDAYSEVMKPFIEGNEEDRISALASRTCVSIFGRNESINEAASKMQGYNKSIEAKFGVLHEIQNQLYVYYHIVADNAAVINAVLRKTIEEKKIKELEKTAKAWAAEPDGKKIRFAVDVSWPMSPREIQQAIDVLKNIKPVGEDGLGLKSATEALESFKKSLESTIAEHTPVIQKGTFFKLGDIEM